MLIFPAIDIYEGKAVRLYKGDYANMTVYSENPLEVAEGFVKKGAEYLHMVDLEGAKSGTTPNLSVIREIAEKTPLFTEVGGGIRSMEVVSAYLESGVDRVILGTAAVTDEDFLKEALAKYGERIAVGVDIRDGFVSIKGWTESSGLSAFDFLKKMEGLGVKTIICTDISRDGAMKGTNRGLYKELGETLNINIIASGGVSTMDDILALKEMGQYGAIIGKAIYTGDIDLSEALEAAK